MEQTVQPLGSAPLTPSSLRKLLGVDVFNAIPRSVVLWLYQYKFPLSQQYIVERIISKAIQRPANRKKLRVLFSYNSLSKEVNGCDRKTVMAVVNKLKLLGILKAVRDSCYGTVYDVNISETQTKENITYRRQTKTPSPLAASSAQKDINNEITPSNSIASKPTSNDYQEKTGVLEAAIKKKQSILEDIKKEHQKVLDRYSQISANRFGQKFDIRKKESPEAIELCDKAIELSENIKAIEGQINSLKKEKEGMESRVVSDKPLETTNNHVKASLPNQKTTRFIRPEDVRSLKTRLDELKINGHQLTPAMREQVLNEIVWSIRFGHLSQKEGSTFYLVNHALLLMKDNVWRTPIGFEMNQIARFTNWVLNKRKAVA